MTIASNAQFVNEHGEAAPPPPSMRDELDRKAEESLERLIRHHAQGKIGSEAMGVGARAVWETISGLASESTSDLATRITKEIGHQAQAQTRIYRDIGNGSVVAAVSWTPGETRVRVLKATGQVENTECLTEGEAKERFERVCGLLASRYEEWH